MRIPRMVSRAPPYPRDLAIRYRSFFRFAIFVFSIVFLRGLFFLLTSKNNQTVLTVYELYYSNVAWSFVRKDARSGYFRGMCVTAGSVWPHSWDVSAPSILPILEDSKYQRLLCEYGAIFATAIQASKWVNSPNLDHYWIKPNGLVLRPTKWVGFQSWNAVNKRTEIREEILPGLIQTLSNGTVPDNAIIYWATHWEEKRRPHFYSTCVAGHGGNCPLAFSAAFERIFGETSDDVSIKSDPIVPSNGSFSSFLVPMSPFPVGWSLCSYFILSSANLVEYAEFAAIFFVALESVYNVHDNTARCPLLTSHWTNELCWCFLMERVVNVWWYHTGKPMFFLDRLTGHVQEHAPVKNRTMSPWFGRQQLDGYFHRFRRRLRGRSLLLYQQLRGDAK